jgi:hypothetical protein
MSDTTREPVAWEYDVHTPYGLGREVNLIEPSWYDPEGLLNGRPLYRDPPPPTLTDAEREAVATASRIAGAVGEDDVKATLRALLARLGGAS